MKINKIPFVIGIIGVCICGCAGKKSNNGSSDSSTGSIDDGCKCTCECNSNTSSSDESSVDLYTSNESNSAAEEIKPYAVVKTNSDLTYDMAAGCGTSVNVSTNTVNFNGKLTHGSFNHLTGKVYTPSNDGKSLAKETALTANDFATQMIVTTIDDKVVYTAMTFKINFSINFGPTDKDKGLYLNNTVAQSSFTVANNELPITARGFRMAFVPDVVPTDCEAKAKVFADLQTASECRYANGMDNYNGTLYVPNELIDSEYNAQLPINVGNREEAVNRPDYLATFKAPTLGSDPRISISYTIVVWFEETDPEIINRDDAMKYQTVISKLVFDAIDLN